MADTTNDRNLLADIRELEQQVAQMEGAEVYPVSFFSHTFELSHRIIETLHRMETNQIEALSRQMEEHRRLIESLNEPPVPAEEPEQTAPAPTPVPAAPVAEETPQPPVAAPAAPAVTPAAEPPKAPTTPSLNELLAKRTLADFRKAFSLNDRFRFRRELFNGDEAWMNRVIADLNELHSYEASVAYLRKETQWKSDDEAVTDFLALLEKRFH